MTKTLSSADLIQMEETLGAHTYSPLDIVIERAEGVWLHDVEGKKYLDCTAAYSSQNLGHCNPELLDVFVKQAGKLTQVSRALRNDKMPLMFEEITKLAGKDMVLPMNTGAEGVETAIKIARKWAYTVKGVEQDKAEIIVCSNNFHGRTVTIVSFSSQAAYRDPFGPVTPGFKIIPYGDIEALKAAITPNTCGFLMEPIQGEGGIIVPQEGFLKEVEKVCKENNVLLMLDEIQTGFCRTGKMFAHQHEDVNPDMLIVGKSLAGGFYPVSAVLADKEIMEVLKPGEHGSTFSGNPLGSAVALKSLQIMQRDKLAERAEELGNYFMDRLKAIKSPKVKEVRGKGMFIAIEFNEPARAYCDALLEKGVIAKETHTTIIRFTPPLVITKEEIDLVCDSLEEVIA